ncbi:MAG: MAPEG family protein [Pseudomonadota bacterium]
MHASAILGPAAVLALWSLLVMLLMVVTRLNAFKAAGITFGNTPAGARYADVEADMPAKVNWISHNYSHLVEQPTIFYAVIAILAIAGGATQVNIMLAWAYTVLRILHSIWQITANLIPVRVSLFTLSSVCLLALAINAVRLTVF